MFGMFAADNRYWPIIEGLRYFPLNAELAKPGGLLAWPFLVDLLGCL